MKYRNNVNARRAGFTLIELLVVIAIIAVLASLISAAVFGAYARAAVATAKTEITDMNSAFASAQAALNGVSYMPSRLVLREDNAYNQANIDEQRTSAFLQAAFGRQVLKFPQDWNGNGKIDAGVAFVLQGPTAMVFLLGGIPTSAGGNLGCTGFSTNPANPAAPGGTRKGPFYSNFKASRLRIDPTQPVPGFLYYTDSYSTNMPYLYFSSYSAGNDFNTGVNSDCPPAGVMGLNVQVQPYQDVNGLFVNGKGFQIICAGKNGQFGPGGIWNTATGYGMGQPGSDDQANFSGSLLGQSQS